MGASTRSKITKAKVAASSPTIAKAPLPRVRAGLPSPSAKLTSFGEFLWTQAWMWYLRTRWPIQPRPCCALSTYAGRELAKWVMELTMGYPNAKARAMNSSSDHPVTMATAVPRRRTFQRCSATT